MEDALLLHVSECERCLTAAFEKRGPLSEQGCETYMQMLELSTASAAIQQSIAVSQGHLTEEASEEYCFDRLAGSARVSAELHITGCSQCRNLVQQQRLFIACMKQALHPPQGAGSPLNTGRAAAGAVSMRGPRFSEKDLAAARERVPTLRAAGIEALKMLQKEDASLGEIEKAVSRDPVLSAHLVKVANSALMSYGYQVRTLSQAIARIGYERTRLHIWGLSMRRLFVAPKLQKVWNHCTLTAQICRQLAEFTHAIVPDEACLVALVHDIGQMVLVNLGTPYERAYSQRLAKGKLPVVIERELCGSTHAEIGADLLETWHFPADLVDAVRQHHTPAGASSPMADLVYIAEHWVDAQEDLCDISQHRASMRRLGLTRADLQALNSKCGADLEMLRFAA
jgi:putative nucleotidyltransferase with HDIG domain